MSVEASAPRSSSPAPKAGHADARSNRAKGSGTPPDAHGATGFMAILSSMGDTALADPSASGNPLGAADGAAITGDATGSASDDTATLDPTALLAQSLLNPQPVAAGEAAQRGAGDASADNAVDGRGARRGGPGLPTDKWNAVGFDPAGKDALGKDLSVKDAGRGAGLKKQDKTPSLPDAASATASSATQKQAPQEGRMQLAMEIHKALQGGVELAQVVASTVAREEQRSAEKSIFSAKAQDNLTPVTVNGTEVSSSGPLDVPAPITDVGAAVDVQVAEQVQYWISNDIQNAELTLDGLGDKPVEVSITMQGNEAHVTFRTDEAQARSALESAGGQLKEMLQREGLTLGGVFVGHSGGQGSDRDADRRQRQGARQTQIAQAKLEAVDTGRRPTGMAGRAVDLFV